MDWRDIALYILAGTAGSMVALWIAAIHGGL